MAVPVTSKPAADVNVFPAATSAAVASPKLEVVSGRFIVNPVVSIYILLEGTKELYMKLSSLVNELPSPLTCFETTFSMEPVTLDPLT